MSDSFNQSQPARRAPQITALSTAFPLHFQSDEPKPREEARPNAAEPARTPHRHDAGE